MYESKYSKYIIQNTNRFAVKSEVIDFCRPNKIGVNARYSGVPILYDNKCLYVDNSDSHYMIVGSTGSKKTRTSVINTINSIIAAHEHAVVTDPKGELYRKTANAAKVAGYNVKVLNLRNPKRSDCWNPMYLPYLLDINDKKDEAEEMANDFVDSLTAPIKEVTKDVYWADRTRNMLSGEMRMLMDSVTKEFFNISTLMQISKKKNKNALEEMVINCDEKQPFFESMESFITMSAEKTQDCLYDTVQQAFGPYSQKTALLNILCENDIDFFDFVDKNKKSIIYIIYPDEKSSMAFLVNLFLTQCYFFLKLYVDEKNITKLDKRVNFVCEEFGNLPMIEKFSNRISMARSFNIRYFLYIQSYAQMEKTYKEEANTIKGNCEWIIYPSKERDFLKEVSDFAGDIRDYQNNIKPLLSIDRIQHLRKFTDGAEAVVVKSGLYPFIVKMPDYEYIKVFEKGQDSFFEEKERSFSEHMLTMNEWLKGISEGLFNFPFPKEKREEDRRIKQTNYLNKEKASKSTNEVKDSYRKDEVLKELERKFDELFGNLDDDD